MIHYLVNYIIKSLRFMNISILFQLDSDKSDTAIFRHKKLAVVWIKIFEWLHADMTSDGVTFTKSRWRMLSVFCIVYLLRC